MARHPAGGGRVPLAFVLSTWRRRAGALVLLGLLVALTGGLAMAAVAGARRSASSPARFDEAAKVRHVFVSGADEDPAPLAALLDGPLVEDHLDVVFVFGFPDLEGSTFTFAPVDDGGLGVDAGLLRAGRRADPANPDEVVVPESTARRFGVGPGDTLEYVTLSPEQAAAVFEGDEPSSAEGPTLQLQVVGVARTAADIAPAAADPGVVVLTPAFLERYGDAVGVGTTSHVVRLTGGSSALDEFTDAAAAAYPDQRLTFDVTQAEDVQADSISIISFALVALGLLVMAAGGTWIVLAALREQRLAMVDVEVLRALGSTPGDRLTVLAGTLAPALVGGAIVAPALAVALSPLFPVGLARRYEPEPGVDADWWVLVGGLAGLLVLGGAVIVLGGWLLVRGSADETTRLRRPRLGRLVGALPPAPATGVRFALLPPRSGARSVRPAVLGSCVAVLSLVGVAVVGASLDRVVETPARWGTNWDATVALEPESDATAIVDDPDVGAAALGLFDEQVTINDLESLAMVIEPLRGDVGLTLLEGRAAVAADEVVVGRQTLRRLGVSIGDDVSILSRSAPAQPFRIVGVAVFPSSDVSFPVAEGAGFSRAGGDRLVLGDEDRDDAGSPALLLRWAPGVDAAAALDELRASGLAAFPPIRAPEIDGLDDVRWFPAVAVVVLAVLGGIATGQSLAVTARRRRGELALLTVLGFTSSQRRAVVAAQVAVIALIALLIGVPLGIVVGRLGWTAIADSIGVAGDVAVPVGALLVGAAGLVGVLCAIGAIPSRFAAHMRVAETLRAE